MARKIDSGIGACAVALIFFGCSRSADEVRESGAPAVSRTDSKGPAPALAGVHESLKSGAFDDAAARLVELQASGRNFTPREAADYRKAMNEAYTRALEAAEKGDKRAEAAIQMIRGASPH
jgi:hypothetical protein